MTLKLLEDIMTRFHPRLKRMIIFEDCLRKALFMMVKEGT